MKTLSLNPYHQPDLLEDVVPEIPSSDVLDTPDHVPAALIIPPPASLNKCLAEVPFTGQHLVHIIWLFNVKTDGKKKARLVGRGDIMIF